MLRALVAALFFLTAVPAFAQQAEVNQMTPENIAKNAMALSPEMQQQYMQKFQAMTPQQRQAIMNQAQQTWQDIPQDKKEMLKQKAMDQYQSLTPQQKQAMTDQAIQKWQSLSPQEKQQLQSQFQGLLQGNLK